MGEAPRERTARRRPRRGRGHARALPRTRETSERHFRDGQLGTTVIRSEPRPLGLVSRLPWVHRARSPAISPLDEADVEGSDTRKRNSFDDDRHVLTQLVQTEQPVRAFDPLVLLRDHTRGGGHDALRSRQGRQVREAVAEVFRTRSCAS